MLDEMRLPNSVDLYAASEGALKLLLRVAMAGLLDPSPFAKAAGIQQAA